MKRFLVATIDGKHIVKAEDYVVEGDNLVFYNRMKDGKDYDVAWFTKWDYFEEIPSETWWERRIKKLRGEL